MNLIQKNFDKIVHGINVNFSPRIYKKYAIKEGHCVFENFHELFKHMFIGIQKKKRFTSINVLS